MTDLDLATTWLTAQRFQDWLLTDGLRILLTIVFAVVVRWLLHRLITRAVRTMTERTSTRHEDSDGSRAGRVWAQASGQARARHQQRTATLGSLLRSVVTFVVGLIAGLTVMDLIGIPLGPLLASAGVGGVALGFGAQSLVKDYLAGVFMILEDQYGVGDVVDLGEASGTIEEVGLRVTRLRDVNGTVWYVRNGEILRVGNMSQNWARTVLDIGVAYSADLEKVRRVLREVAHEVSEHPDFQGLIIEEPEVWGVEALAPDGVTVRVTLKTAPMEQWKVAREMRERIKDRFDAEGIEIPFPQRVIWHRNAEGAPAGGGEAGGSASE